MKSSHRWIAIILAIILIAIGTWLLFRGTATQTIQRQVFTPTSPQAPQGTLTPSEDRPAEDIQVVAQNLEIPWGIAFLPDGSLLITERPGRLVRIGENRQVIPIQGVQHIGEGGLLGLALHPNFSSNNYIYLYLTTENETGLINRVERYTFTDNQLANRTTIIDNLPGARFHDGGQIKFGPDNLLYVTVGDATQENEAQNPDSLNGTILRLNDDGSIPEGNPFNSAVYSYGHRNPQGLAWDDQGRLWATEHGRSGIRSGLDELNHIQAGRNYGWPVIEGDETESELVAPIIHSGATETWAPAGAAFMNGSVFFGGLRGQSLYKADISSTEVSNFTAYLRGQYGRIRAVEIGPDGMLYISTSNRDGRGDAAAGDDKIIRINPKILQ